MNDKLDLIKKFCISAGFKPETVFPLKGDGSDRLIFRICGKDFTKIAVYGDNPAENRAFLGFCQTFKECRIRVPEIYSVADDFRCYILEDLGDNTLKKIADEHYESGNYQEIEKLYLRALTILPEIQISVNQKIDYSLCYQSQVFDLDNMLFDANRFMEYFLKQYCKISDISAYQQSISNFCRELTTADNFFLYRDFQTRNIMVKDNDLCFIDFQSGRKGPLQYDLASFVYSSGTHLFGDLEEKMINRYLEVLRTFQQVDTAEFMHNFYGFAIIRIIQALGGYAYLGLIKQKTDFLNKIPTGLAKLDLLQKKAGTKLIDTKKIF